MTFLSGNLSEAKNATLYLNTNLFFSNFSGSPGISRQNPGISRQKVWFPWVSKDIPNFLVLPTPSRRRPPPHPKISEPKSLGLGAFCLPEFYVMAGASLHRFCSETVSDIPLNFPVTANPINYTQKSGFPSAISRRAVDHMKCNVPKMNSPGIFYVCDVFEGRFFVYISI